MKVDFKFKLDEKVITVFGDNGIVSMLGVDDGGIVYYVKASNNSDWFKEKNLKRAE